MSTGNHPKLFETSTPLGKDEGQDFIFWVRVTPKSRITEVGKLIADAHGEVRLKINVSAPPEGNKANEAVIELLSDFFKVSKSKVIIVSGQTGRIKKIRISDFSKKEADSFLG